MLFHRVGRWFPPEYLLSASTQRFSYVTCIAGSFTPTLSICITLCNEKIKPPYIYSLINITNCVLPVAWLHQWELNSLPLHSFLLSVEETKVVIDPRRTWEDCRRILASWERLPCCSEAAHCEALLQHQQTTIHSCALLLPFPVQSPREPSIYLRLQPKLNLEMGHYLYRLEAPLGQSCICGISGWASR